ncbi:MULTISPECIES: His-Xaa-Ser system-associated MauG-like protein [Alteromonadaceae]|uniref:His-Xaa-Ser system-associated MauG-like protein n=1 Tax=Alteromonadaceae TaxID=72275 RepID=UPI0026DAEDA5|nr:His-Xaa-Ser system-associated MauG-like protein [Alteromonas sp. LMIT006]
MRFLLCILLFFISNNCLSSSIDFKLDKVIEIYKLNGFDCKATQPHNKKLTALGKELFDSTLLSGGNDTSCSTCHLAQRHRTDGLSLAIGVGGKGEGTERLLEGNGIIVPRNAFTFSGRGHKDYVTYFWDGKVEVQSKKIVNILGNMTDKGFDSPFAMATILPILARDEFLGLLDYSKSNEMVAIDDSYYEARYDHASQFLKDKIKNSKGSKWDELRNLFIKSSIDLEKLELSHLGNAISSFLIETENCFESKWSHYIKGDKTALNELQKKGAYLFYGKGRCASCHSGDLLSDFKFHSIAVPQGKFGFSIDGQDLGRSEISLRYEDRFKFKTPSLLNVINTPPYGHNGIFNTLDEVILFHLNPVPFFSMYEYSEDEIYNYGRVLSSRSQLLSHIEIFTEEEVNQLVEFVKTL